MCAMGAWKGVIGEVLVLINFRTLQGNVNDARGAGLSDFIYLARRVEDPRYLY